MSMTSIDLFQPIWLPEMERAALEVLRSGQIASGQNAFALEQAFSSVSGRECVVTTADLTSAVMLGMHLAGVRAGDEVATLAFSCLQSNSPIARLGARPVWIDIDPSTMSMSIEDLAVKLTPSVKAVMLYHVAGYPSDAARIATLCRDRGIPLIEDCNYAIGALNDGRPVGVAGDYAVYSLYPNRQVNGIDGGILATPDPTSAERAKRLRRFGIDAPSFRDSRGEINPHSDIREIGWSSSLNNLNAAVALTQMSGIYDRLARTRSVAARLTTDLERLGWLRLVHTVPNSKPSYAAFLVLSEHRDALLEHLRQRGVKSSILHQRNDWYTGFGTPRADLPGTELVMSQLLALPCGHWLTDTQVNEIIISVKDFNAA